jgi:polyisoprenoid-binding protein YceI
MVIFNLIKAGSRMKIIRLVILLALPVLFTGFGVNTVFQTKSGVISFRSDAPLELIRASSRELRGAVDGDKKTFAFRVRVRSFEGFNSELQKEHFNENYLQSEKYPEATFSGKIIEDIDFSKPGSYTIRAKGKLTVHGVEQERIIKSDIEIKSNKLVVRSRFTIQLSDHNIPIPRVVNEKLASEIKVEVAAEMEK